MSTEKKNLVPGLVLASLGAVAFSGKAIIVKLAYRYGVDAITLIMLRMLFALPLFALMAWWAGRGKPALTLRDWLGVVVARLLGLLPRELPGLRGAGLHLGQL
ncbi:drug/metabolite transporter (DMT)-like permease [Variovorax sp. TBS-050B]|nr:drug/metabolite transporter (DMT)-like permease [Variovorax sp. TBS-050B]